MAKPQGTGTKREWAQPHRRKARRRHRLDSRDIAAHAKSPFRDKALCPTPGKVSYATKHHAKTALKRALPDFAAAAREHDGERPPGTAKGSLPRAYRCRCGVWHLGHLPKSVRSGPLHRGDEGTLMGRAAA